MESEIYLDKIKLGALIVEKELTLIELYNILISDLRLRPEIEKILEDYPVYHNAWKNLAELYDFLEYDYADKLKDKKKIDKITKCMKDYKNLQKLSLRDLGECVDIVRKIMSISKFHDVVRKGQSHTGLDKLDARYKLGKG